MTVEELMKPRYKVIADYPNSEFEVGTIINFPNKSDYYTGSDEWESEFVKDKNKGGQFKFCIKKIEPFPHLFKKLEWWEDRAIEDMPEYVKCIKTPDQKIMPGDILKPIWNGIDGKTGGHYIFLYTNCFIPSTEAEYTNYINSKQHG